MVFCRSVAMRFHLLSLARIYVWHSLSYSVFVADMFGPHSRQSSLTVFGRVGGHLPPRRFRRRVLPPVLLPVLVAVPAAVLGTNRVQSIVSYLFCLPSDSRCLGKPDARIGKMHSVFYLRHEGVSVENASRLFESVTDLEVEVRFDDGARERPPR